MEMEDAARTCGFRVVAAVTAVAEHSIMPQYAADRPDESDEKQLVKFSDQIAGKNTEIASLTGNRPYKKSGGAGLVPLPKQCQESKRCNGFHCVLGYQKSLLYKKRK